MNKKKSFQLITAIVLLLAGITVVVSSCKKDKAVTVQSLNLPDVVSFHNHIIPLFNSYCISCHSGGSPSGNLDLSANVAYTNLFAKQEVDTLHPEQSVIYIMMNSTSNPMPQSGRLSDYYVALMLKWIAQKGKNN